MKQSSEKLEDCQLGMFKILEKLGEVDYQLDLPESMEHIHLVFHVYKLYPYWDNPVNSLLPEEPTPVYLEDKDKPEYKVKSILNSQIRWKGYDASHNS